VERVELAAKVATRVDREQARGDRARGEGAGQADADPGHARGGGRRRAAGGRGVGGGELERHGHFVAPGHFDRAGRGVQRRFRGGDRADARVHAQRRGERRAADGGAVDEHFGAVDVDRHAHRRHARGKLCDFGLDGGPAFARNFRAAFGQVALEGEQRRGVTLQLGVGLRDVVEDAEVGRDGVRPFELGQRRGEIAFAKERGALPGAVARLVERATGGRGRFAARGRRGGEQCGEQRGGAPAATSTPTPTAHEGHAPPRCAQSPSVSHCRSVDQSASVHADAPPSDAATATAAPARRHPTTTAIAHPYYQAAPPLAHRLNAPALAESYAQSCGLVVEPRAV
jgi:hypothetical protein